MLSYLRSLLFAIVVISVSAVPALATKYMKGTMTFLPMNYTVEMTWYESDWAPGEIYAGGSIFASVKNSHGELVDERIVLSTDFIDNMVHGQGKNCELFLSMGKMLENIGGFSGFVAVLEIFGVKLPTLEPREGDDAVLFLVNTNKKGDVQLGSARVVIGEAR